MAWLRIPLLLGMAATIFAAVPRDRHLYNQLVHEFMAPCCWQQRLDIHDSPAATELRRRIAAMVDAGMTAQDVRAKLVAEYGVRILPEPPGKRAVVLYVTPFLVLGLGAGAVVAFIHASRKRKTAPDIEPAPVSDLDLD